MYQEVFWLRLDQYSQNIDKICLQSQEGLLLLYYHKQKYQKF